MIYDSIMNIEAYRGINRRLMKGLEILKDTDFSSMADGIYEAEGKDLFYFLQSYETKPFNDKPEAHKLYADIMMMLDGKEQIGVAPLEAVEDTGERPEGDIRFYCGKTVPILLEGNKFAVFFPGDAHAPGIAVDGPEKCRKCVVKVRLD